MTDRVAGNSTPLLEETQEEQNIDRRTSSSNGGRSIDGNDGHEMASYGKKRAIGGSKPPKNPRSRRYALVKSFIHIPSVAITLGVLSLTFRHVFWERPADNTNTVLNSLQFAAQVHGSLIVMSLSAMLLHVVHRGLDSTRGVPLGFLSSSFQLNSFGYLFGKELTSLELRYIAICVFMFALAMLSGPSSAIAMIPRLQFWSMDNLWLANGQMEFHVYIGANRTSLYPEILTADSAPPQCLGSNSSIMAECPSYGIRHWMMQDDLFTIGQLGATPINISIEETWVRYLVGSTSEVNQGIQSVYSTSTLATFLGNALFAYDSLLTKFHPQTVGIDGPNTIQSAESDLLSRYDLSLQAGGEKIATRKPLVEVECAAYPGNATSLELLHDRMAWPPWTTQPVFPTEWSVSASDYASLSVDSNSTILNSTWIDIEQFGAIKPSLGAYFASPETVLTIPCPTCATSTYSLYTCTIDARWMPTRAFYDASAGKAAIFDSLPDPNGLVIDQLDGGPVPDALPSIYIAKSWADLLDVPWIDSIASPTPSNRTILETLGQKCLDSNTFVNATFYGIAFSDNRPHRIATDPMKMLQCLQVSLSVYIADAIARTQNSVSTYFVAEGHVQPDSPDINSSVYLVQDLYYGDMVSNLITEGRVMNITPADFADTSRFTEIYMPASRWGYGYGFQDSDLIIVGTVVLLLHVALCVAYVAWILGTGASRRQGWETYGELVWMALRSGSLARAEEGVSMKKRWKERFVVRETTTTTTVDEEESGLRRTRTGRTEQLVLRRVDGKEAGTV